MAVHSVPWSEYGVHAEAQGLSVEKAESGVCT